MDNHYHLVIETPDGNLSKGMRQLDGCIPRRSTAPRQGGTSLSGTVQGDFSTKGESLSGGMPLCVLNPVRAKAVQRPQQWKWSSFGGTAGMLAAHRCLTTDDILAQFGHQKALAQRKYREFVESGIEKASIWEELKAQSLLGIEGFAEALLDHIRGKSEIREIPKGQRFLGDPLFRNSSLPLVIAKHLGIRSLLRR
jgi:putative transposase